MTRRRIETQVDIPRRRMEELSFSREIVAYASIGVVGSTKGERRDMDAARRWGQGRRSWRHVKLTAHDRDALWTANDRNRIPPSEYRN
jgi:hypothetical protein